MPEGHHDFDNFVFIVIDAVKIYLGCGYAYLRGELSDRGQAHFQNCLNQERGYVLRENLVNFGHAITV